VAGAIYSLFGFVPLACSITNVGSEFLFTLGFVPPLHFSKRFANQQATRVKQPVTLGAAEAQKLLALDPNQFACHRKGISVRPLPDFSPSCRKIDIPRVTRQRDNLWGCRCRACSAQKKPRFQPLPLPSLFSDPQSTAG
jgi:hypothetical protein